MKNDDNARTDQHPVTGDLQNSVTTRPTDLLQLAVLPWRQNPPGDGRASSSRRPWLGAVRKPMGEDWCRDGRPRRW